MKNLLIAVTLATLDGGAGASAGAVRRGCLRSAAPSGAKKLCGVHMALGDGRESVPNREFAPLRRASGVRRA